MIHLFHFFLLGKITKIKSPLQMFRFKGEKYYAGKLLSHELGMVK